MGYQDRPESNKARGAGKSPETLYEDIQKLINNDKPKEAIGALEMFLAIHPNYSLAHNDLGVLYFNQGHKEKAVECYERAAQLDPYNVNFQKNLADFYYVEAGRMGEALQIYVKLLDANPTDIEILLILGQICVSLKKTDDARVFFNKVLELEPWNMDARERLDELGKGGQKTEDGGREKEDGWMGGWVDEGTGVSHFESAERMYQDAQGLINDNRKIDAVDALEKLVTSYPDYALAHNDLGVLYFSEGHKEKSLQHYEKAAQLAPQNSVFQKNLADFYYVISGRTEEALKIYLKILEANPTDMETLLIIGHICVSLKRFDDAKAFYNRALEIEPWNVDAREKLEQLAKAQKSEVGGQRTEDGWTGGGMDEGIETDLGAHVVNEELQLGSSRFVLSLILSSENSECLIRGTDEEEDSSAISDQIEIVVGDKALKQNKQCSLEKIQRQSRNIIYVETGEGYPQDAVDALKFVAKRVNDSRNVADVKKELVELSSSTGISTLDPDMADRFISLFERLSDALKELAEPFRASSVTPEEPVAGEKVEIKKGQDVSDGTYKGNILNRIVKMKDEKDLGWKDIAEVFNSEGLPTFSGKGKWHRKTIYKMYQKTVK